MAGADERFEARLERLAERAAASVGVELAWTEIKGPRGNRRVCVFIERAEGAVGLADCERMNARLSTLLDLEEPPSMAWSLEISTPGLDRPLHSLATCARFLGRRVRVRHRVTTADPAVPATAATSGTAEAAKATTARATEGETAAGRDRAGAAGSRVAATTGIGTLLAAEDGAVVLEADAGPIRIPWSAVLSARLDPDYGAMFGTKRGDASGNGSRRSGRSGRGAKRRPGRGRT